jgi:hypothetical protein
MGFGRRYVAVHEAGHCMAGYLLKQGVQSAEVMYYPDGGLVQFRKPHFGDDNLARWRKEQRIMALLAGMEATRWTGRSDKKIKQDCKNDRRTARALCWELSRTGYEAEALYDYLGARVRSLITSPRNWPCVVAVADELEKWRRLTGDEVYAVIRKTLSDPPAAPSPWQPVEV